MNKSLLVGRLVRDPETHTTNSGISYSRFTIAVDRPFGEEQTDFVPIVAWRSQSIFVDKYIKKGYLVAVEGRFTSSTYKNSDNQTITRYEITADRIEGLESKTQVEARKNNEHSSVVSTQVMRFEEENSPHEDTENDVPWELDL